LHGDGEKAVLFAKMLRESLVKEGVSVVSLENVVG
jgi:lactam utilization protein B